MCDWQDDLVQLSYPATGSWANKESRHEYQQIGIKRISVGTKRLGEYSRNENWWPLLPEELENLSKQLEGGIEYCESAGEDASEYYWRKNAT